MTTTHDIQDVPLAWAYRLLNHGPLVLISTTDGERPNVCTVAWAKPCQKDPPRFHLTIGTGHRTYKNLAKTGVLGINVPTAGLAEQVLAFGRVSGDEVDKIARHGVPIRQGAELPDLPLLDRCAAWLECRVTPESLAAGTKQVEVEALAVSCRPGVLTPQFTWDVEAFPTLHHLGGSRFIVGERVLSVD